MKLTTRELDILCLAAKGEGNFAIGHKLGITEQTVKNHLYVIYSKLFSKGYRSGEKGRRVLAVLYALRTGQLSWREIE